MRYLTPYGEPRETTRDHLARANGIIELQCRHGVGHPVGHDTRWLDYMSHHECDGCCEEQDNGQDYE